MYRHECCGVVTIERLDEWFPHLVVDFLLFFLLGGGEERYVIKRRVRSFIWGW